MDLNLHVSQRLTEAISALAHELCEIRKDRQKDGELKKGLLAIEKQIARLEDKIMSQISELTERFNARFDEIGKDVDGLVTSQASVAADVAFLKETIAKFQSNPGPISPEDQVLIDAVEARLGHLATKTAAVAAAMKDLDALTENPPPA